MKTVVMVMAFGAALLHVALASAGEAPPNVASDVRVVADRAGGYVVEWQDNSDDEIGFEIGFWAADAQGVGGNGPRNNWCKRHHVANFA